MGLKRSDEQIELRPEHVWSLKGVFSDFMVDAVKNTIHLYQNWFYFFKIQLLNREGAFQAR